MFRNREDAAMQLAQALVHYRNRQVLVLGIPRGGVETAYYVARELHADFSLIVCRKLGHPKNPEYGFGAVAEDGSLYLNEDVSRQLPSEAVEQEIAAQRLEAGRRVQLLRGGEPLPSLRSRTVILVDDGIATGVTLFAAIEMCRRQQAERIVVAAPVSAIETKRELEKLVNEVVILETPVFYRAVSQVYRSFQNLSDEETIAFLERWKKEKSATLPGSDAL